MPRLPTVAFIHRPSQAGVTVDGIGPAVVAL